MREFLWLTEGEASRLWSGLFSTKWGYEARWEAAALMPLIIGLVLAFGSGLGIGFLYLWACKCAVQGMIHKGFFDRVS